MSALATALVRLGDEVTGADRTLGTPNIRFLESIGVKCFPDDGSGVDAATGEVVVSTAIEDTNPGLAKAKELGIPVTHRAKALARALESYKLVAVVGTCGKSTVTAMLGHVLAECGLDPMCVNGANVPGWEGAVRMGRGAYAVAEVDESDKSLVAFRPYAAIVTNASADHYSKEEMDEVFDAFVKDLPGPLVDGRSTGELFEFLRLSDCLDLNVPVPGKHNLQNAQLAAAMAVKLGCDPVAVKTAISTFKGVERRLQRIYPSNQTIKQSNSQTIPQSPNSPLKPSNPQTFKPALPPPAVYDDYAHNPEKLKAMWTTLAEAYPQGICVVWRPHGYAPLRKMMDALAAMFNETVRPCDRLLLLPVYDAGGTTDRSVNSDALFAKLAHGKAVMVPDLDAAYAWIAEHRGGFAALATCGARDPGLPVLARRLAEG